MIWFQEDTWEWQEYKLIDEATNTTLWLSVEEIEGNTKYSIYYIYAGNRINQDINIVVGNERYTLHEKGIAIVKSYYGNVDVDVRERVNFVEYISESKESLFSIENWDGEIERTMGRDISPQNITITNEINQSVSRKQVKSNPGNIISIIISLGIIFVLPLFSIIGIVSSNKTIEKYLKSNSSYTYVTSVTNNSNNKKANIYKSSKLTIDQTVKDIIDGVPEKINKVSQTNNSTTATSKNIISSTIYSTNNNSSSTYTSSSNGVGLITNSEYAYVYKGDDNIIYVQISKKDYVNNSSTVYHSRSHAHYYRTYSSPSTTSSYDSYLSSARQSSINSRVSSGGGTSSGK